MKTLPVQSTYPTDDSLLISNETFIPDEIHLTTGADDLVATINLKDGTLYVKGECEVIIRAIWHSFIDTNSVVDMPVIFEESEE